MLGRCRQVTAAVPSEGVWRGREYEVFMREYEGMGLKDEVQGSMRIG